MALQTPHHLLMIRPASFGSNPETSGSNTFQQEHDLSADHIKDLAVQEFDSMVDLLNANDIQTFVIPDTDTPVKPDAIFPNNWVSMQPDGKLVIYPMLAINRRLERRNDILDSIRQKFEVEKTLDFSPFENKGEFVEGTGSIIFDHRNRFAFAAQSPRTTETLARAICEELGYKPVIFKAVDALGIPIYHTNVMMAVATDFVLICLDSIQDETEQEILLEIFRTTGHQVIAISFDQMKAFSGNVLEVLNKHNERVLIISETAVRSLLPGQLDAITKFVDVLPVSIPTIEKYSGGSVRCMLAGIHLATKE